MFERFTERARKAMVLAQEEAGNFNHNYIGTEHILLGLLREEEGLAARVLESLDITVERVRAQVVRIVGSGEEVTSGQIPFTPRAKKVLELGLREALALSHSDITTYHLLLGLLVEGEGVAARVLRDVGADAPAIPWPALGFTFRLEDAEPELRPDERWSGKTKTSLLWMRDASESVQKRGRSSQGRPAS